MNMKQNRKSVAGAIRSQDSIKGGPSSSEFQRIFLIWALALAFFVSLRVCEDENAQAREATPVPEFIVAPELPEPAPMCSSPVGPFPDHLGLLMSEVPSPEESQIVSRQIDLCKRSVELTADPYLVLAVLRLEHQLGVPPEAQGILNSVWCIEASMRLEGRHGGPIRGDYHNGVARAHGPAQLWAWHRNWCGLTEGGADDLVASLTCYWQRVVDRREKRALHCDDSWRVGEALAANGPRYRKFGCKAKSGHWEEMEAWKI